MKRYDVVVIGGSAAGLSAAVTARRHYPSKSIAIIRKEEKVLIPCGIPYIFGTVESTDNNLIPDSALDNNAIELIVDEADSIDREKKIVGTAGGEKVAYDKLIISTGSTPLQPPIPGIDKENVFFVHKDVNYLNTVLDRLDDVKNVIVLGGGFIGVEFADEFRKRNLNVSIIEMLSHCLMLAFEESFCVEAENILSKKGVKVITEAKLEEILGADKVEKVKLSDGSIISADLVLVGIGVKPNIELAEKSGLETTKDGIIVDEHMRTSDENVFACGDCTTKKSFFNGKPSYLKLASIATMEARVVGANLFESKRKQDGVIGVFSTVVDDTVFAVAGLGEAEAKKLNYNVFTGEIEAPNRHPGKMPGMTKIKLKLVFNRANGELLGGTARGGDCVGEIINTVSACIQKRMTADDIAQFQLGTHPAVTASPIAYQLVNAAELAIQKLSK